jgi:hypothetical protein
MPLTAVSGLSTTDLSFHNDSDPSAVGAHYLKSQKYWELVDNALATSEELRERKVLPRHCWEETTQDSSKDQYLNRLSRAFIAPWYRRLIRGVIGHVMRKSVSYRQLSDELEDLATNIDGEGQTIADYARDALQELVNYGYGVILVDFPQVDRAITLSEEKQLGLRPTWSFYSAKNVLDAQHTRVGNELVLTSIRLLEYSEEPSGRFGKRMIPRIRHYSNDLDGNITCTIYERVKDSGNSNDNGNFGKSSSEGMTGAWVVVKESQITSQSKIPVEIVGELGSEPVMLRLAEMQLQHYYKTNDLDHSIYLAANPKLMLWGVQDDEVDGCVKPGASHAMAFRDASGHGEWIAAPMASYEAQMGRIKHIEESMSALALSAITQQKNVQEAEASKRIDASDNTSMMKIMAELVQRALDGCVGYTANFIGIDTERAGVATMSMDFELASISAQTISAFSSLVEKDQLSVETLLELLIRGEQLPDQFDMDEELERIRQQQDTPDLDQVVTAFTDGLLSRQESIRLWIAIRSGEDIGSILENIAASAVVPEQGNLNEVLS